MANLDLSKYGITGDFEIIHNPSYETLFQDEMNPANEGFEKAKLTKSGATAVYTGKFTHPEWRPRPRATDRPGSSGRWRTRRPGTAP